MKTLIIGLDGATFDLLRPWAEAGHLPNLHKLMKDGVHRDLNSTMPPVTSPAWPTFMTGCNPGKHGVFDFIQPSGANYTLVNASKIKQPTIWQRLSAAGYRVGVLNVPVTYPPSEVDGFMVTGILSPKDGQFCYPPDLIDRYKGELGAYRIAPNIQYKAGNEEAYIADIYSLIRAHGDWALALMAGETWDVMMVHFIALDIMMHALWRFMDHDHPRYVDSPYEHAIRDGYKLVDAYVGKMLTMIPEETAVFVMSDHGFGPLHNIVNLNNFLIEKGLLVLKNDPMTRTKAAAFKHGVTPAGVYKMVEKVGLQNFATRVSKNTRNQVVGKFLSFDSVDWSKTIAYSMGHVGQVYINTAGREPEGIVTEAEYKARRQEVIEALAALEDKNGRSLLTKTILREDTYHGDYAKDGPDIHLVIDEYNMIAFPLFATDGNIISSQIRGDSGCHRSEGVFIAHAPAIKKGECMEMANILDLAPTIMAVMGEPVPSIMDGRVLTEIFTEPPAITYDEREWTDIYESKSLQQDDEKQVEDRLRSLGYL